MEEDGRVGCAETGSREPSPSSTGSGPSGFDPARGTVTIPRQVYDFLMGEDALEGVWFNDLHKGLPGRFWWRGVLRSAAGWPPPSLAVKTCGTCGREFEIRPAPEEPWPNCLAPDCGSYDPNRDLDGGGPEWDAARAAIAMEARQGRDGETRLDPKDSAGLKGIAQKGKP